MLRQMLERKIDTLTAEKLDLIRANKRHNHAVLANKITHLANMVKACRLLIIDLAPNTKRNVPQEDR